MMCSYKCVNISPLDTKIGKFKRKDMHATNKGKL